MTLQPGLWLTELPVRLLTFPCCCRITQHLVPFQGRSVALVVLLSLGCTFSTVSTCVRRRLWRQSRLSRLCDPLLYTATWISRLPYGARSLSSAALFSKSSALLMLNGFLHARFPHLFAPLLQIRPPLNLDLDLGNMSMPHATDASIYSQPNRLYDSASDSDPEKALRDVPA